MRIFSILFLLSSCSYHWTPDFPNKTRPSLFIPYVMGDGDGTLTSEITRAVIESGIAEVRHGEGNYRLQVQIVDGQTQVVGYRRDREKVTGGVKKNIVACEGRKTVSAEVTLYEGDSDRIAFGPYTIAADADYDYLVGDSLQDLTFLNAQGALTRVLPFSLGQLESVEAAQEAATKPLYEKLARKIVDVIAAEW